MTFHRCHVFKPSLYHIIHQSSVLKPGPDRPVEPVEPATGQGNGPVNLQKSSNFKTGLKTKNRIDPAVEPLNHSNRSRVMQTSRFTATLSKASHSLPFSSRRVVKFSYSLFFRSSTRLWLVSAPIPTVGES